MCYHAPGFAKSYSDSKEYCQQIGGSLINLTIDNVDFIFYTVKKCFDLSYKFYLFFLQFMPKLGSTWIDTNSDNTLMDYIIYNAGYLNACKQECCHLTSKKEFNVYEAYRTTMPFLARKNINNKYKENLSIFLHRLLPLSRTVKFYL
jgi:hypothetical protein